MSDTKDDSFKLGFALWLSICFVLCVWFLGSFIKGRRQFQTNLHVIEDGLRRMQEEMELKLRKKSIGYVENMEEITALFHNADDPENYKKQEDIAVALDKLMETKDASVDKLGEVVDKKND